MRADTEAAAAAIAAQGWLQGQIREIAKAAADVATQSNVRRRIRATAYVQPKRPLLSASALVSYRNSVQWRDTTW